MEDGAKKRGCSERNISRKRKRFEEHVASLADNNAELCTCELCSESEGSTFYKKRRKNQESDSDSDSAEGCDDLIQEENESDSDSDSAEGCDDVIQEENESDSDSDSAEGYNDLIQEESESDSDPDNAEGCDDPTEGENDHGEVNLNEGNGNSEPEPSEPSSPENSDSGSDDEDNFDLNDELLNQRLELAGNSTVRDALAVLLSVTVRFKLPLVALEALLKGHNTLLGYRASPHDKRKLWKVLKRNSSGIDFLQISD
ncbi:Halomucin [Frankliniella fusca]|uniref:Halomucin n=1 Tax=Frankliniella fusca TaxID=407009 RepID=A0AAE1HJ71_9NEOP|nr:Halomucin [Frankliniella fusca]